MRWRTRLEALALGLVLVATMTFPVQAAVNAANVAADADWIMTARLSDGAIANYVDRQAVWPYLSNFAAMGLAKATTVTGNASYVGAAWSWLSWYQAHMNPQGFVTDYTLQNGVLTSTGDMDSTDAYAGTFLLAVREAYRANANKTQLTALAAGVSNAVRAIEATQDTDGLTWAKPSWHVKYLMDQGESYAGLLAAVDIANVLRNSTLANQAMADALKMKNGVATLWNAANAGYDWAKHDTGATTPADWSVLYSDSLQEAWAVAFGLVDTVRSPVLLSKFNTAQASWHLPTATAVFSGGSSGQVGYWPVAGLGFDAIGSTLGATASNDIRSAALSAGRAWPFTTGNAGELILLESGFSLPLAAAPANPQRATVTSPGSRGSTLVGTQGSGTSAGATTTIAKPTTTTKPPPTTTTTKPPPTTTTTKPPLVQLQPPPPVPTVTVPTP